MNPKLLSIVALIAVCVSGHAASYYVNDASTTGDVFCSAPGAIINSGTSSTAPKASLRDVLDTYVLAPGDTVFIDSGSYTNTATPDTTATVGSADSGSQIGGVVTIQGAGSAKTFIYAANSYGIYCLNASYVRIDGFAFRDGA